MKTRSGWARIVVIVSAASLGFLLRKLATFEQKLSQAQTYDVDASSAKGIPRQFHDFRENQVISNSQFVSMATNDDFEVEELSAQNNDVMAVNDDVARVNDDVTTFQDDINSISYNVIERQVNERQNPPPNHILTARTGDVTNDDVTTTDDVTAARCPVAYTEKLTTRRPLINLRRDKFLLAVLCNGPNNQLMGFRETIYLAIRLNRTVVVPSFYKHRTDGQLEEGKEIAAMHRVDLEFLSKLVPMVTLAEFRRRCGRKVAAVFRTRGMNRRRYWRLEQATNMTFPGKLDDDFRKTSEFPIGYDFETEGILHYNGSASRLLELFGTDKACAVYPWPFKLLKIRETQARGSEPRHIDVSATDDVGLYSEIVRFARQPPHVEKMAVDFIWSRMQGREFVAVHWRYDSSDWMRKCLGPEPWGREARLRMCATVRSFTSDDFVSAIRSRMTEPRVTSQPPLRHVYVAAPHSEREFVAEIGVKLKKLYGYRMYTSRDVEKMWQSHMAECDWLEPNHDDLLSSTEMAICKHSAIFLGSRTSSWTTNVMFSRTPDVISDVTRDGNIFDLVLEARNERLAAEEYLKL